MICVLTPCKQPGAELDYILSTVLGHFLGLEWRREAGDIDFIRISLDGQPGEIRLPNIFFRDTEASWSGEGGGPSLPLIRWDSRELALNIPMVDPVIPVIFGERLPVMPNNSPRMDIPIDIFGSAFFMLSNYEEAIRSERDSHDRFPAPASVAVKSGFIDRPIVDEYVEILWACMKSLWPNLQRKINLPRTLVSCDVDHPYQPYLETRQKFLRRLGGDLVKRRRVGEALMTARNYFRTRSGDYSLDTNNTFEWIMDVNEKIGNRVAFYFIVDKTVPAFDAVYSIHEPRIRRLMRDIHARGHEIGLHGSYGSYMNGAQLRKEADILRRVMEEEKIDQPTMGARQHYLRWSAVETARHLDKAGVAYDTSLSYADHSGFRCGTCHEFPMFDLQQRKSLNIIERPLIVMESSVIDQRYMGLGYSDESLKSVLSYKKICHDFGGDFTLLWHNSHLQNGDDRRFYCQLIT